MTISPIRSIAAAAEGGTVQPSVLPPGLITTASGQVVGFQPGGISPLAQSAGYPDAAPARVRRRPRPRQGGRSSVRSLPLTMCPRACPRACFQIAPSLD